MREPEPELEQVPATTKETCLRLNRIATVILNVVFVAFVVWPEHVPRTAVFGALGMFVFSVVMFYVVLDFEAYNRNLKD